MKNLLTLSLLFFIAFGCSQPENKSSQEEAIEVPIEEALVEEKPKVIYTPTAADTEQYALLQKEISENVGLLEEYIIPLKYRKTIPISQYESKALMSLCKDASTISAEEFIANHQLDKTAYKEAVSHIGLTFGYALVNDFKENQERYKYNILDEKLKELIKANLLPADKTVRYKAFEADLNKSSKPAPGAKPTTMSIDKNGVISINGQKMGKVVETDGMFAMQIDQSLMIQ